MDGWERARARKASLEAAESAGLVADSEEARRVLMERMHSGAITLAEAQAELKRIKRNAKKNGLVTRNQAYLGR